MPLISEVQATVLPNPYCQADRIGSFSSLCRMVVDVSLGVVVTYPDSIGTESILFIIV